MYISENCKHYFSFFFTFTFCRRFFRTAFEISKDLSTVLRVYGRHTFIPYNTKRRDAPLFIIITDTPLYKHLIRFSKECTSCCLGPVRSTHFYMDWILRKSIPAHLECRTCIATPVLPYLHCSTRTRPRTLVLYDTYRHWRTSHQVSFMEKTPLRSPPDYSIK